MECGNQLQMLWRELRVEVSVPANLCTLLSLSWKQPVSTLQWKKARSRELSGFLHANQAFQQLSHSQLLSFKVMCAFSTFLLPQASLCGVSTRTAANMLSCTEAGPSGQGFPGRGKQAPEWAGPSTFQACQQALGASLPGVWAGWLVPLLDTLAADCKRRLLLWGNGTPRAAVMSVSNSFSSLYL